MFSRARVDKAHGCALPDTCKAVLKASEGDTNMQPGAIDRSMKQQRLSARFASIITPKRLLMANDICNRAGLDTISAGGIIAFAIELYENGILTSKDTDGIDLTWGTTGQWWK